MSPEEFRSQIAELTAQIRAARANQRGARRRRAHSRERAFPHRLRRRSRWRRQERARFDQLPAALAIDADHDRLEASRIERLQDAARRHHAHLMLAGTAAEDDTHAQTARAHEGDTTFRRGCKVVLRPDPERDVYDRMLHGRGATVERIYVDLDERIHLAVSIDDDPGQDLMRDSGRYHYFKPEEVELT